MIATGNMRKGDASKALKDLRREARPARRRRTGARVEQQKMTPEQAAAIYAGMGIPLQVVPPKQSQGSQEGEAE